MAVKQKIGTIVSNKMQNTIVVEVDTRLTHKKYQKVVTKTIRKVHSRRMVAEKTREDSNSLEVG